MKVLGCVPRLCQLGPGRLSRRGSSCVGVSATGVQEGAVFWKPLRHVCQAHHAPTQHRACPSEPPHLGPGQPGNTEGTHTQARPHPDLAAAPGMQHPNASAQELVHLSVITSQTYNKDNWIKNGTFGSVCLPWTRWCFYLGI